jgi:DNA-binding NarL/FixJ family response regulator
MRVILVDDAPLVREGFARLLVAGGVDVVAQLSDATDLLGSVRRLDPDAVVMDVRMPPTRTTEGLRAAVELKRTFPEVGVLMLSQYLESRLAVELLSGTASGVGYLLKERVARPAELLDAVRRVAEGGTAVDPDVVRAILETKRAPDPLDLLTDRERDVLALVAEGQSNDAIADHLVVTTRTVETHMAHIFTKLGLDPGPGNHRRVLAVLAHLRAHVDLA